MNGYTKEQLNDMVRDLEAELYPLRRKYEWRAADTAPEQQWILAAAQNGVVDVVQLIVENGERQWFTEPYEIADRYHRNGTFTHWMPLPAPPKQSS